MTAIRSLLAAAIFTISINGIALAVPPFTPPGPPSGVPTGPPNFVTGSVPIPGTDWLFGLGMIGLIIALSLKQQRSSGG
jgi:hypothetical protein